MNVARGLSGLQTPNAHPHAASHHHDGNIHPKSHNGLKKFFLSNTTPQQVHLEGPQHEAQRSKQQSLATERTKKGRLERSMNIISAVRAVTSSEAHPRATAASDVP
jgi:hypothetical protein